MADPGRLVDALGRAVVAAVGPRPRVAVAWSAGLASTLVAVVARKRVEVVCYCVGRRESRDRRAARAGARVLDFPLVELDAHPRTAAEAIAIVSGAAREDLVLTGETARPPPGARAKGVARPLLSTDAQREIRGRRAALVAAARLVGIPEAIAAARRRGPRV